MTEWATDKIEELQERITVLKAERDEYKRDLDQASGIYSLVNEALNRAGVFCAITFAEGIDKIAADRDAARASSDQIAVAFEQAMSLVKRKVQLAYVSAWVAGRVVDERVPMSRDIDADAKLFMEALASYRRWEEDQAKKRVT